MITEHLFERGVILRHTTRVDIRSIAFLRCMKREWIRRDLFLMTFAAEFLRVRAGAGDLPIMCCVLFL